MKVKFKNNFPVGLLAFVVAMGGCGKKSSDDDSGATPTTLDPGKSGVTEASGEKLQVAGTLSLGTTALADAKKPNKVMVWIFDDNGFEKVGKTFDVSADGTFSADVPRVGQIDLIKSARKSDGTFDKDVLAKLFPDHASEVGKMTDAMIDGLITKMEANSSKRGGHLVVLTSIDDSSGTKVEQADSMRFVGLPGKGGNISVWPAKSAKGNFSLGNIKASGKDEATSDLALDSTTFDLGDDAAQSLASVGKLLKSLKNNYINGNTYRAEPFFQFFQSEVKVPVAGEWTSPANMKAARSGFYVAIRGTDKFTFDQLCDGSKVLSFVPPSDVQTDNGTRSPASPYNSKGTTKGTQGNKITCTGGETGIYLRKDSDDGKDIEVNWSLKGSVIPEGWWHLKSGDEEIGTFDLSAGNPVDSEGNPRVFILKAKVDVNDAGVIKSVSIIPTVFDKATKAYVDIKDLRGFRQLTSEVSASFTGANQAEVRVGFSCSATSGQCDGDTLMSDGGNDSAAPKKIESAGLKLKDVASSLALSYKIGDITYRTEFRGNN